MSDCITRVRRVTKLDRQIQQAIAIINNANDLLREDGYRVAISGAGRDYKSAIMRNG